MVYGSTLYFFILISGAISNEDDARSLVKALVLALFLGIIFRMGTFGIGFVFKNQGEFTRIGGNAFGPAVSYGGYLAFGAVLGLYLARSSHRWFIRAVWLFITAILLFEMLNTHTRGAILSLFLLVFLFVWASERRFLILTLIVGFGLLIVSGHLNDMIYLASQRNLVLNTSLLSVPNALVRFELWRYSIFHIFDRFGFGYGIGNALLFMTSYGREFVSHNLIFDLTQSIGGFATIIFVVLYILGMRQSFKFGSSSSLMAYLFTALAVWFLFANTTSTSIVFYYPFEATLLMYLVLFITLLSKGFKPQLNVQNQK